MYTYLHTALFLFLPPQPPRISPTLLFCHNEIEFRPDKGVFSLQERARNVDWADGWMDNWGWWDGVVGVTESGRAPGWEDAKKTRTVVKDNCFYCSAVHFELPVVFGVVAQKEGKHWETERETKKTTTISAKYYTGWRYLTTARSSAWLVNVASVHFFVDTFVRVN